MSIYTSSKISIVKVENAFSSPNTFEIDKFILPLTSEYSIEIIDKNKYHLKKKKIFPINPGQPHCSETNNKPIIQIPPFLALFIQTKTPTGYRKIHIWKRQYMF